jgi:hypothetical protein
MHPRGLFDPPRNEKDAASTDFLDDYKSQGELKVILATTRHEIQNWLSMEPKNNTAKVNLLATLLNDNNFSTSPDFKSLPIYIQRIWLCPLKNLSNQTYTSESDVLQKIRTVIKEEIVLKNEPILVGVYNSDADSKDPGKKPKMS